MQIDKVEHKQFLLEILMSEVPVPMKFAGLAKEVQDAVNEAEVAEEDEDRQE